MPFAKILVNAIRDFALCDVNQTAEMLRKLSLSGIRYAAVLLAEDNAAENEMLSKLSVRMP